MRLSAGMRRQAFVISAGAERKRMPGQAGRQEAVGSLTGGRTMPSRMGQQLSGRSFLYRTPQALQSVRGPNGPHRHCGVWWQPQLRHTVRRPLRSAVRPGTREEGVGRPGAHPAGDWHGMQGMRHGRTWGWQVCSKRRWARAPARLATVTRLVPTHSWRLQQTCAPCCLCCRPRQQRGRGRRCRASPGTHCSPGGSKGSRKTCARLGKQLEPILSGSTKCLAKRASFCWLRWTAGTEGTGRTR